MSAPSSGTLVSMFSYPSMSGLERGEKTERTCARAREVSGGVSNGRTGRIERGRWGAATRPRRRRVDERVASLVGAPEASTEGIEARGEVSAVSDGAGHLEYLEHVRGVALRLRRRLLRGEGAAPRGFVVHVDVVVVVARLGILVNLASGRGGGGDGELRRRGGTVVTARSRERGGGERAFATGVEGDDAPRAVPRRARPTSACECGRTEPTYAGEIRGERLGANDGRQAPRCKLETAAHVLENAGGAPRVAVCAG